MWSPNDRFVYLVQGPLEKLDVWRMTPEGARSERITAHEGQVSHPVMLDERTLIYLATDADGSGPWLYTIDTERRVPRRLTVGVDHFTSLAADARADRLVATVAHPKRTLWRVPFTNEKSEASEPVRVARAAATAFAPRFSGSDIVYAVSIGARDSLWKLAGESAIELWSQDGARIVGGPALSGDGSQLAFSVRSGGDARLFTMPSDGGNARLVTGAVNLQGSPAWSPDGRSIVSGSRQGDRVGLVRVPVGGGRAETIVPPYATEPVWSPSGGFLVYSGPDVGTTFAVKTAPIDGADAPALNLTLTRGARRLAFIPGQAALVFLRGTLAHKDLWRVDLPTGAMRQLTKLPLDFNVADFDVAADGRGAVLERVEDRSNVVMLDRQRRP